MLIENKERKANTLEARVYRIITSLAEKVEQASLDSDVVVLTSAEVWDAVKKEIEGQYIETKPQSYETVEYGTISQRMIASILEDRFEAERPPDPKARKFRLSRTKLNRLGSNYSSISKIEVKKEDFHATQAEEKSSDASDASDASRDNETHHNVPGGIENGNNSASRPENKQENDKDIET